MGSYASQSNKARLCLFGSSKNGFGFRDSDLDICMTLEGHENAEIFDGKQIPQRMVDGWNAFFFDDMEELKKRLPSLGKNTESLGELWLGLLRFYTEEFDFKEYVISIRQKKLLTTFEKQWTSKCIAIEDPFDLNHNLGAGVSRKSKLLMSTDD
ncbi:terminal uridylyltransferase hypothetical protein [Limosa lapponica baueri]|uniref:Polymerase nucleotidyl transferase domain-containing protein n=1 Tax=Limosa lapponica baueri TaxID=1758121 RepID=A0A2I0T5Q2_LIMLA|nr:terminal uridylyltransferase hypothetical protein [Limosa lapponica baueri]